MKEEQKTEIAEMATRIYRMFNNGILTSRLLEMSDGPCLFFRWTITKANEIKKAGLNGTIFDIVKNYQADIACVDLDERNRMYMLFTIKVRA